MRVFFEDTRSNGVCPYLPDRDWASHALWVDLISPAEFGALLERGYRRSGRMVYQPRCGACRECRSTRVLVEQFRPNRSQRRALRRNADLSVAIGRPTSTAERLELHNRYCSARHVADQSGAMTETEYQYFMIDSPVRTLELSYRYADGTLAGIALIDDLGEVWSSVFTFFDCGQPDRSLGTWSILKTLELAREHGAIHLHLGFTVAGCRAMNYKLRYQPAELLGADGQWRAALQASSG